MKRANDIGQHIAKLRRMRGWSQETLAAKIQCLGGQYWEMTRQVLGNIESGRRNVYHWHIQGIRAALDCAYDDIFNGPKVGERETAAFLKTPPRHR